MGRKREWDQEAEREHAQQQHQQQQPDDPDAKIKFLAAEELHGVESLVFPSDGTASIARDELSRSVLYEVSRLRTRMSL